MALFSRFIGGAASYGAGFAFGHATGPILAPAVEQLRQEAWDFYRTRVPEAVTLAAGVATGKTDEGQARDWAHRHGFGDDAFDSLVAIARTAPEVGLSMQAWRRGIFDAGEFTTVLRRHGIEDRWFDAIRALKQELLPVEDLARAIHRGLIPDPGLLEGQLPQGVGNVPAYPVYNIDAVASAAGHGFTKDQLGVLVGLQGNPMGAHEAAQAFFRGVLTMDDFLRALAESNTRNEWGPAIMAQSRQIPTSRDFLENALRGYRTLTQAIAGAELHGMTPEHATMIYQNQGRPMPVRRITQALARGAKFNPEPGEITDPYRASIVEGSLKPGYYELEEAMKYTPPSVFAIRQLAQSGTWDEAKTRTRLLWLGWEPTDAAEVAKAWTTGGTGAAVNPWLNRAKGTIYTGAHSSYLDGEKTRAEVLPALEKIGNTAAEANEIVDMWDVENSILVKPLTAAQIKKAYTKKELALDEAVARLVLQQWTTADAQLYLQS